MGTDGTDCATGIARRCGNLVDEGPLHVVLAQLIGVSGPGTPADGVKKGVPIDSWGLVTAHRADFEEACRLFALGVDEVVVAIDSGQQRDVRVGPVRQDSRAQAGERGRDPDRRDGVTQVVLTVSKRAFAVLPRLAPMDGGQRDEACRAASRRTPRRHAERAASLDHVPIRCVVIDRRHLAESWLRADDQVRFGRVEVAAGRIDAKGPSRAAELLPGRQAQRIPQEIGEHMTGAGVGQRTLRRAAVRPERIRLRRPIQITERLGEAVEIVLGAVVIIADV